MLGRARQERSGVGEQGEGVEWIEKVKERKTRVEQSRLTKKLYWATMTHVELANQA